VDLLRRFAEPDAGRILLDDVDLTGYEIESLRRRIVVLESEPTLFRENILYNLRYGNFDASDAAVLAAANRAGVDAFVASFPESYDTELGSGGIGLSTGQRQRMAVARALLGDPVIVVLDEATSNLDAAAARSMHILIDEHFAHRTRLVITHAPQMVPRANCILQLRAGRLQNTEPGLVHV
jgi:ATP-binding cassette subfamily B protein